MEEEKIGELWDTQTKGWTGIEVWAKKTQGGVVVILRKDDIQITEVRGMDIGGAVLTAIRKMEP